MDMPDGWEKLSYINEGWMKGKFTVMRLNRTGQYFWFEHNVLGEHGGFPDPVSCAVACVKGWFWYSGIGGEMGAQNFDDPVACMVACELENGGCTDGHA